MNENSIVVWLALTGIGIGGSLIMYLLTRAVNRLDKDIEEHDDLLKEHSEKHEECRLELSNFKAEVARDYAKDSTIQNSLARVHQRIDSLPKEIIDLLKGALK